MKPTATAPTGCSTPGRLQARKIRPGMQRPWLVFPFCKMDKIFCHPSLPPFERDPRRVDDYCDFSHTSISFIRFTVITTPQAILTTLSACSCGSLHPVTRKPHPQIKPISTSVVCVLKPCFQLPLHRFHLFLIEHDISSHTLGSRTDPRRLRPSCSTSTVEAGTAPACSYCIWQKLRE